MRQIWTPILLELYLNWGFHPLWSGHLKFPCSCWQVLLPHFIETCSLGSSFDDSYSAKMSKWSSSLNWGWLFRYLNLLSLPKISPFWGLLNFLKPPNKRIWKKHGKESGKAWKSKHQLQPREKCRDIDWEDLVHVRNSPAWLWWFWCGHSVPYGADEGTIQGAEP